MVMGIVENMLTYFAVDSGKYINCTQAEVEAGSVETHSIVLTRIRLAFIDIYKKQDLKTIQSTIKGIW